jgi:N-acetylneuraminic acid mutarotase
MNRSHAYLLGFTIIGASLLFSQACTKSTDTDDLVGNWKAASDFDGNARSEAVIFIVGNNAYLSTGTSDKDRFKDLWMYNNNNKYWTQLKDLPATATARNSAVGFAVNGKGYIGTGYDGVNKLKDFWEYDPASDSWTQKDDMPGNGRYDATAFVLGNKAYVSCGYDGNYLKDLYEFDPTAATGFQWTQRASIGGTKRLAPVSFVINNKAYICSGNNNGTALSDLWEYDASLNTWTEKRKIYNYSDESYDDDYSGIARINGVAFIMSGKAYLTAGENGSLTSTTWEYDPATDLWAQKTGFEGTARTGAVAFTLNDRGFVLTGRSGSQPYDNGYEFKPGDEQVDND